MERTEEMKQAIRSMVKNSVEKVVSESVDMRMEEFRLMEAKRSKATESEEKDEKDDESEEKADDEGEAKEKADPVTESEEKDEDSDKKDDEESDEKDDEDEDDALEESLSVVAKHAAPGGKGKVEDLKLANLRELTRLAKTGKYEYFTVTSSRGDESEYHVDKDKLVLM